MKMLFSAKHLGYKAVTAQEEEHGKIVGVIRLYKNTSHDIAPTLLCTIYKGNTSKVKVPKDIEQVLTAKCVRDTFVIFMQEFGQYGFPCTKNSYTIRRYLTEWYGAKGLRYTPALEASREQWLIKNNNASTNLF